jgi:hypothetical protein
MLLVAFALAAAPTGIALAASPSMQGPSISVGDFLAKADALEKKGMVAMFSSDARVIKAVSKADIDAFAAQLVGAFKAHRALPACVPMQGDKFNFTVTSDEVLRYYRAIPPQRRGISSRQAFAEFMSRKFPCRG